MSEGVKSAEEKAAEARRGPPVRRHGPGASIGAPVEKPMNFRGSATRLLGLLRPDRVALSAVLAMTAFSVALTAVGPLVLARATDLVFAGVLSARLAPGTTQDQAVAGLRTEGQGTVADILAAMDNIVPGQGIDFDAVASVLLVALALYVVAALVSWAQGRLLVVVVNRGVFALRRRVEEKLNRLPLPYFDRQPRGEVLSRVSNDIDNVAQSLQQTLSQLLTSLLTVVAMVAMMFIVSPLLALVALITIPVAIGVTAVIGKRAQGLSDNGSTPARSTASSKSPSPGTS